MIETHERFGMRFKKHMLVIPKDVGESERMFRYRYWWITQQLNDSANMKNKEELIVESKFVANERFLKVTY